MLHVMQESRTDLDGVGLIGLGEVGEVHAEAIRDSPVAYLAAVADLDESLVGRYSNDGTRGYAGADELIADPAVRTVSICLPHHLHYQVAKAAIAAGKNVLLEKPLTISLGEGEELVALAKTAGVVLGVSHNQIFFPAHLRARGMLEAGSLGRPVFIRLRLASGPPWGGWRSSTASTGGGFLIDAGIHRLYMATFFFGPVTACHAVMDAPRESGETLAVITLRFASGAWGVIEANQHGPEGMFEDEIEIIGSEAALRLPGVESKYGHRDNLLEFRANEWRGVPVDPDDWAATVRKSVSAYLDAVHAGREPAVDGEQALETMRLLYRVYESAVLLGEGAKL
jgi:predicted dehydrogenase